MSITSGKFPEAVVTSVLISRPSRSLPTPAIPSVAPRDVQSSFRNGSTAVAESPSSNRKKRTNSPCGHPVIVSIKLSDLFVFGRKVHDPKDAILAIEMVNQQSTVFVRTPEGGNLFRSALFLCGALLDIAFHEIQGVANQFVKGIDIVATWRNPHLNFRDLVPNHDVRHAGIVFVDLEQFGVRRFDPPWFE